MEQGECLELEETIVRPFPDMRWCRVDIGRYRINDPSCSDPAILTALLADARAAESYIGQGPYVNVDTKELVHGPYVLSKLGAASFSPSTPEELWARLQEFVDEWEPVDRTLADLRLDDILLPAIEGFDSVYRLPEDRRNFHELHALLEILGCFSEFVVINRADRTVLDIITSQD